MGNYKVQLIQSTDESHDMYGTKYSVKFAESDETFELWYKSNPQAVGDSVEGEVVDGRFKKIKPVWNGAQKQAPKKTFAAQQADRGDGMRQGMCMNNAANYVAKVFDAKPMTYTEWASEVYQYANALYAKGDLGGSTDESLPTDEEVDNIEKLFS